MKVILVIDIEEDMIGEVDYTILTKGNMSNGRAELKPLPQKKILDEELFMTGNFKLVYARFTGWNDCIDEILGE